VRRTVSGKTHRFAHLVRQSCGQHSYQWIEDPSIVHLNAESLGDDVAREMLECYYWTRTFKFAHHELCLLRSFIETDAFGLGMVPAHYARRLQVQIQPLVFAFLLPDKRLFEETRCCRALEALAAIKTARTEVVVEVDLAQGSLVDIDYERFSESAAQFVLKVKLVIESLKERGLRVILESTQA
jgi:hypothetical protein